MQGGSANPSSPRDNPCPRTHARVEEGVGFVLGKAAVFSGALCWHLATVEEAYTLRDFLAAERAYL